MPARRPWRGGLHRTSPRSLRGPGTAPRPRTETRGDPVGFRLVAVAAQPVYRNHLERRPAERRVPLVAAAVGAGLDPPGRSNSGRLSRTASAWVFVADPRPQRIEGGQERVVRRAPVHELVVEVQTRLAVPQISDLSRVALMGPCTPARASSLSRGWWRSPPSHLHQVEQGIEADGIVVDDVDVKGAEAVEGSKPDSRIERSAFVEQEP